MSPGSLYPVAVLAAASLLGACGSNSGSGSVAGAAARPVAAATDAPSAEQAASLVAESRVITPIIQSGPEIAGGTVADMPAPGVAGDRLPRAFLATAGTRRGYDNFETGSTANWQRIDGNWSTCQLTGTSVEYCGVTDGTGEALALAGDASWTDYRVEGYVRRGSLADDGASTSILGRVQDSTHFYQLKLGKDGNGVKSWFLSKKDGVDNIVLASGAFNYLPYNYYRLALDMRGNALTAQVSTDWGQSFSTLAKVNDSRYAGGRVGVRILHGAAHFDEVLVLANGAVVTPPTAAPTPTSAPTPAPQPARDPWLWPFASTSIWNMPIGSNAQYVPANFKASGNGIGIDEERHVKTTASDPLRQLYMPSSANSRCTGTVAKYQFHVPDSFILDNWANGATPNDVTTFLQPDGDTLIQLQPAQRCVYGGPIYGFDRAGISIRGDGILGTHWGSGLSGFGGSLRKGELLSSLPIRHALKLNIWGKRYLSYTGATPGYRWPADRADDYASRNYGGTNSALAQGSLLALPPSVNLASLNLATPAARKLAAAMQDYGAYVTDDSAWDDYDLCAELGVSEEYEAAYGAGLKNFTNNAYRDDMMKVIQLLQIVNNNSPTTIGGGGIPRQPLAPPL